MAVGLFIAAPAFAQTATGQKQPTQEGGGPSMQSPGGIPYNANPGANPNYKQQTQEGGGPSMQEPCSASYNANPAADPNCRLRAQNNQR
jgi:hypothetical protein